MDSQLVKKAWRCLEAVHGMIYFVPEADEEYIAVGLEGGRMGYFASRAAAMGPVPAEVVIATFYNFNPELVRGVIPRAWALATPEAVLGARLRAVDRALRRAWTPEVLTSPTMLEVAALLRQAAEAVVDDLAGRPLFAAHASLPWPEDPHLVVWHAQTLLREHRGDGHVAALLMAGLDPVEALVTHAAGGDVPAEVLRRTRRWSVADWAAGVDRLVDRGLLAAGEVPVFSPAGREVRIAIEEDTTSRASAAYVAIGEESTHRLVEIGRPLGDAVIAAGLLRARVGQYDEEAVEPRPA
jgi:hypothetical protein